MSSQSTTGPTNAEAEMDNRLETEVSRLRIKVKQLSLQVAFKMEEMEYEEAEILEKRIIGTEKALNRLLSMQEKPASMPKNPAVVVPSHEGTKVVMTGHDDRGVTLSPGVKPLPNKESALKKTSRHPLDSDDEEDTGVMQEDAQLEDEIFKIQEQSPRRRRPSRASSSSDAKRKLPRLSYAAEESDDEPEFDKGAQNKVPSGLPKFRGKSQQAIEDPREFLDHFQKVCLAHGLPRTRLLAVLPLCLDSTDSAWLERWVDTVKKN
jgi:hypothetical protein